MAVTIHQEPQAYTPSDNPVIWTFSSDETGQDNFSFLVELYINGALDSRHIVFPQSEEYAYFDASERLYARTGAAGFTNAIVSDAANHAEAYITVYEKYGTPATLQDDATSSTITAFKACLGKAEFIDFVYTDHVTSSQHHTFLTDFDRDSFTSYAGKDLYLSIITDEQARTLHIDYYDSSDVLISTQTEAISGIKICQINLNPSLITIPSGTAYFNVVVKQAGAVRSETVTVQIGTLDACDISTHLIWMNKYGAFDQYTFTHNRTEKTGVKRFGYEKQFGGWNGTTYEFNTYDSGQKDYMSTMTDGGEISSEYLTEDLQRSVVKSIESPFKVIQDSSRYQEVTISNNSYDNEQERFNDLFNVVLNYELSQTRNSPKL